MDKRRQEAHPESVLLALRALGANLTSTDDAKGALGEKQSELRRRVVEPVIVAWEGRVPTQRRLTAGSKATLVLEDGTTGPWPPRSPLLHGYHRLYVSGARAAESLIISAPVRAHFPVSEKISGVFAPLYALHSKRSPEAGDLTELESLMDWTADRGGRVISTLPLLATFLDEPFEPSPYSPISRLFWNEFYVGGESRRLQIDHEGETASAGATREQVL
jgi:4-alpha-glucanotransferase